jgi:phosphate-selective porin OprO and OprP
MKDRNMKLNCLPLVVVIIGAQIATQPLRADDTNALVIIQQLQKRIEALEQKVQTLERSRESAPETTDAKAKQRVEELDQKVGILERNREVDQEIAAEKSKGAPTVSLGANGLVVRSADSNFVMNVHGYAQVDGRFYPGDRNTVNDTFLLRRVRPIIEGTVYDRFDYRLMLDFGSGSVSGSSAGNVALLDDAFVNARLWPQAQIQVGKFKSPVGLERLQSTSELLFVETGFATQLTPNYDLGVMVHNNLFNTPINYAVGIFNGAADAASDDQEVNDEGKDLVGRLFFQPFLKTDNNALQKLGFGVAGSIGNHAGALPSYKTPGQQTFFAYTNGVSAYGQQYRIDPQFYYYWGPFGVIGEYVLSSQKAKSTVSGTAPSARFNNTAWQIEATWFLTGEENSFRSSSRKTFTPGNNFSLGGEGWGALELVGRVQQLSLDNDAFPRYATGASTREATAWGVGLNWYLNSNVRLYLDYESTTFKGGSKAAGSVTADDEQVILGQVQFNF